MNVFFDDSDFKKRMAAYLTQVNSKRKKAIHDVASEILRLSQEQVPHKIGTLQNSGHVEDHEDESVVGYNTVYAARLHEHPEYRFQNGRKGKYLEDPIKHNLLAFKKFFEEMLS